MGRRGQGQGGRPDRRARRRRHPLPGGQQRGPHHRPRRRDVQVPPHPLGHPLPRQGVRDRQRRRGRPAGARRGDRGAAAQEDRPERPAHLGQRPPDHALPPAARPRRRGPAREARDRHDQARHRPVLFRQGLAAGDPDAGRAGREDPQAEDRRGARAQAAEPARVRQGPPPRPPHDDRGVPRARPPPRALHRRHPADRLEGPGRRPAGGLRGGAGHAAGHRPRHLSVRDLLEPRRGLGLRRRRGRPQGDRRSVGHLEGLLHPRRRRALPHRAARRDRRPDTGGRATSSAPPPGAPAGAGGWTWSPCATPCG